MAGHIVSARYLLIVKQLYNVQFIHECDQSQSLMIRHFINHTLFCALTTPPPETCVSPRDPEDCTACINTDLDLSTGCTTCVEQGPIECTPGQQGCGVRLLHLITVCSGSPQMWTLFAFRDTSSDQNNVVLSLCM